MQEQDKISYKIKALIDKANSTDSLAERESFMMKANELLSKYNLEVESVMSKEDIQKQGVQEELVSFQEQWERHLMSAIVQNNQCKMLIDNHKFKLHVIGRPVNVTPVLMMFDFFRKSIAELSIKSYDNFLRMDAEESDGIVIKRKPAHQLNFINSYILGAVNGVKDKMEEQKRYNESVGSMVSLMALNEDIVDKYIREHYPSLGYSRGGGLAGSANSGAFGMGRRDGYGL